MCSCSSVRVCVAITSILDTSLPLTAYDMWEQQPGSHTRKVPRRSCADLSTVNVAKTEAEESCRKGENGERWGKHRVNGKARYGRGGKDGATTAFSPCFAVHVC